MGETPNIDILRQIYYSTESPQTDKIELLTAINCLALIEAAHYVNNNSEKRYPIICQLIDWAEKIGILANMLAGNGYLSFICCDNIEVRELLWKKASTKQKVEMLTYWEYSVFEKAKSKEELKQLYSYIKEALAIEGKPLLESDLFSSPKSNCTKVPDALIQFFYSKDEFSSEGDYDIMGKGGIIEVSD